MERKLTQKELAAKVSGGLDYTYIGKIEREEQLPSLKILMKLSKALSIPLSSFFREEDEQLASLLQPGKVVNLAAAREMSVLLKELNQLHGDDIPLLVEIVRALNKHRKFEKKRAYSMREKEYPLVAEKEPDYDDGK
jgi:transcriptional regulator with XRE-family HTH domain